MQGPLGAVTLARHVWQDFRRLWRELLVFDVVFQIARAWLVAPLIALMLAFVLLRAGHVAVNNQDIINFLLTPWGVVYAALFAVMTTFLFLVEQAGLLAVVSAADRYGGARPTIPERVRTILQMLWQVCRLGATKVFWLCATGAPFVLLAVLTYVLLLTQYDIYYYLSVKPPEFWIATVAGAVLALTAGLLSVVLFVRWSLALPILLLEVRPAADALSLSRQSVRGAEWPIARALLGWLLGMLTVNAAVAVVFRGTAVLLLSRLGNNSLTLLGSLLVLQAVLQATMSFLTAAGLALLVHRIYLVRRPPAVAIVAGTSDESFADGTNVAVGPSASAGPNSGAGLSAVALDEPRLTSAWLRTAAWLSAAVVVGSPVLMWSTFARQVVQRPKVLVTAHRGYAKQAPENTLIALQKAIDVGADYAEIDVHQTQDGVVVLLHDRDFRRVAGDSRRLEELTFAEVRQLDVGSWFAPEFADQRPPTLVEAIALCRGRIRLNIELKVFGSAESLALAVARIVREQQFEAECIVTSLNHEALTIVRQNHPTLSVGLIIGQSIGDVNLLDVDALSVRAEHLSDQMLQSARRQDRPIMVWGISGEQQIVRQLNRKIDNLITSDLVLALQLRDRWQDYTDRERLVIATRLLLGLSPAVR